MEWSNRDDKSNIDALTRNLDKQPYNTNQKELYDQLTNHSLIAIKTEYLD